jgi:proteasome alpha subunit
MTEEPYRWLETIANRREYVVDQLKSASPVFGVSLPAGLLLFGVGTGRSKVFEVFDRHALAGLGHPADIEKVRQTAIDTAHLEAFNRAPEDVSLRRLVAFGLSPLLKNQFEQIYSAPFLGEFLFAELGAQPAQDVLVRLHYDGSFLVHQGGAVVAASQPAGEAAAQLWLQEALAGQAEPSAVVDRLLQAWWCLSENRSFTHDLPPAEERRAQARQAVLGKTVELGWLARQSPAQARFRALAGAEVGL